MTWTLDILQYLADRLFQEHQEVVVRVVSNHLTRRHFIRLMDKERQDSRLDYAYGDEIAWTAEREIPENTVYLLTKVGSRFVATLQNPTLVRV